MRTTVAASLITAVASTAGPAAGQGIPRAQLPTLVDSLVAAELAGGPTAGLSIAVWQRGELLFARGYGFADLEHRVPAGVETVYKVGSVTKQFTAAALLRLVDQGRIGLDDELGKHLPDLPTGGRRVTVAQLLDHTSGIKSYTDLGPAISRDSFRLDLEPARIAGLLEGRPFDFEPGTGWRYNNSGYLVAGLIIERVSGQRYADYLRQQVIEPLGLTGTSYCDERAIVPHRASGYRRVAGGFANAVGESMAIPYAAGAVCSTVLDLVRFRAALGAGRLISRASYERMIRPAVLRNGWRTNYGFGLARYRLGSAEVIRHGGTITGFQANLAYLPKEDVIVAALANTSGADPVGVTDRILQALTGQPVSGPGDHPLSAEQAARLEGRYRLRSMDLVIEARGGAVTITPAGGSVSARLLWQGGSRFVARPAFAFGFYGSDVALTIPIERAEVRGFTLHHPLGGTLEAARLDR